MFPDLPRQHRTSVLPGRAKHNNTKQNKMKTRANEKGGGGEGREEECWEREGTEGRAGRGAACQIQPLSPLQRAGAGRGVGGPAGGVLLAGRQCNFPVVLPDRGSRGIRWREGVATLGRLGEEGRGRGRAGRRERVREYRKGGGQDGSEGKGEMRGEERGDERGGRERKAEKGVRKKCGR